MEEEKQLVVLCLNIVKINSMTNKEKIKIDCAIAYFMGWRIDNSFPDKGKTWRKGNSVELETTFKFSTDWNCLMEVYTAINNLPYVVATIKPIGCSIYNNGLLYFKGSIETKHLELIEAVYRCFGEFISVYNERQCTK